MTTRFTELERIMSAISDGNATDSDVKRMNELLRNDSEARRYYMTWMDMETNLGHMVGAVDEKEPVADVAIMQKIAHRFYWKRTVLAVAASILMAVGIGVGIYYLKYPTIAVLTSAAGNVNITFDSKTARAETGRRLLSGMEISTAGSQSAAMIKWTDGSFTRLPGDSRMTIAVKQGQKEIRLLDGFFEAEFSKQHSDRPALVFSPYVSAEIMGTTIRMENQSDQTQLSVINGRVRVRRQSDGRSVQVLSRHEVKAGNDVGQMNLERFIWADRYGGGDGGGRNSCEEKAK